MQIKRFVGFSRKTLLKQRQVEISYTPTSLITVKRLKDRVGWSRRDSPWAHLNDDISLDIQGIKTYEVSKNCSLVYLFPDVNILFCVTRLL